MLHSILALAASGQQVLLRTHRAWMPSDAKARPYDTAVSKFHSIVFIFFAMPSVLVPLSLFLECLKVRAAYRSCRLSTWSDGCCSLLAAFSDWFVWVYLAGVGSSLFSANYVRNPRIGSCVCRTVDHRTDFKGFWDNVSNFRNTFGDILESLKLSGGCHAPLIKKGKDVYVIFYIP